MGLRSSVDDERRPHGVAGVEVVADPFLQFGGAFVPSIPQGFAECGAAPGATTVLGRGSGRGPRLGADRVSCSGSVRCSKQTALLIRFCHHHGVPGPFGA
jgi:hypothetical protein